VNYLWFIEIVCRNNKYGLVHWNLVKESILENTLSDVHKLVDTVLTAPVSTVESELCFSTLKQIKDYLRNSMGRKVLMLWLF
jgi:hypothetical protein